MTAATDAGWIGPRLTARELGAILFSGVVGIMIAGVGPLLFGALQQQGRLSAAQLGQAGTVELLTMGVAAGLTGAVVGVSRLRALTIACGVLIAALNLLTLGCEGRALVLVRGVNGVPSGALVWLMTAAIVRTPRPERWSAIYLTVQGLAQLIVVAALGTLVSGPRVIEVGFGFLAALGLATVVAGTMVPRGFAPLPVAADEPSGWPSPRGLFALTAPFCFNAAILAVWIYVDPLSRQAGHPAHTADLAVSFSLAAQVAGGLLATVLAGRVGWSAVLIGCLAVMTGLMGLFAGLPSAAVFLWASALFGFLWMFAAPFMTPLVIDADPTRRAAVYGSGVAILGCGAGPFLASLLVSDDDVRGCAILGAGLMVAAIVVIAIVRLTHRRVVLTPAA